MLCGIRAGCLRADLEERVCLKVWIERISPSLAIKKVFCLGERGWDKKVHCWVLLQSVRSSDCQSGQAYGEEDSETYYEDGACPSGRLGGDYGKLIFWDLALTLMGDQG